MNEKISVIIPVFKVEKFLNRCIDSVINQTYKNLEIILVDDGSPDKSGFICDEYAKKDGRIKVIHKKNGGLSDARNKGIEQATGEYLTFLDGDDWLADEFAEKMLTACKKYGVKISMCGFCRNDGENINSVLEDAFSVVTPDELFCKYLYSVCSTAKLFDTSLFSDIRFPKGKLHEDEFTTYKALFKCEKIAVTNSQMYFYYTNFGGITRAKWSPEKMAALNAKEEQLNFFKKFGKKELENRAALSVIMLAKEHLEQADKTRYKKEIGQIKKKAKHYYKLYKKTIDREKFGYLIKYFFPIRFTVSVYFKALLKKLRGWGLKR